MDKLEKQQSQKLLSEEDIKILAEAGIIPKDCPPAHVALFGRICQEKGLSPFNDEIHLVPFNKNVGTKDNAKWEKHYKVITGIMGYRSIAEDTKLYVGNDDYLYNDGKTEFQCREEKLQHPTTATATVYKLINGERVPFTATVSWAAYFPQNKNKQFMYDKNPFYMLGKCAEVISLKKAFPNKYKGIYSELEIPAMENVPQLVEHTEITVNDVKASAKILEKYKKKFQGFKTPTEIEVNSKVFLEQATSEGLIDQHQIELAEFSNKLYSNKKQGTGQMEIGK